MTYSDPYGLAPDSAVVVFWKPVGKGESSFGHVSVVIDGVSYSYGPSGMDVQPADQFLARNQDFRSGFGIRLNITQLQEQYLARMLRGYDKPYNFLTSNCGDPVESGLEWLGYDLGINFSPAGLANSIMDAGLWAGYYDYPQLGVANGWNAPWTKK